MYIPVLSGPLSGNGSTHLLLVSGPITQTTLGEALLWLERWLIGLLWLALPWWSHCVSLCLFVLNPRACVYGFTRLMVLLGRAADGDFSLADCLLFGAIMSATDPGIWPCDRTLTVTLIISCCSTDLFCGLTHINFWFLCQISTLLQKSHFFFFFFLLYNTRRKARNILHPKKLQSQRLFKQLHISFLSAVLSFHFALCSFSVVSNYTVSLHIR